MRPTRSIGVPVAVAATVHPLCHAGQMVLEVADIVVTPGSADHFAAAYLDARHLVLDTPGCRSVRMTRGVESANRFVLLVEWESVAAHDEQFRSTDRFTRWRTAIGRYFAEAPRVEHFTDVV